MAGGASVAARGAPLRELYPDPEEATGSRSSAASCWIPTRASTTSLFQAGRWARELWERFSMFMDRFHVAGWRRWVFVEPLSEGATLGAGGLVRDAGAGDARRSARPPTTTG